MERLHQVREDGRDGSRAEGEAPSNVSPLTGVQRQSKPKRAKKGLSPERRAAGAPSSALLSRCVADSCHQAGLARSLEVSPETVSKWCDPLEDLSMTIRDLSIAPPSLRRAIGRALVEGAAIEHVPVKGTPEHLIHLTAQLGRAAERWQRAAKDRFITQRERDEVHADFIAIHEEAGRAARDIFTGAVP